MLSTREAIAEDIPRITAILNYYIANAVSTFQTDQHPLEPSPLLDTYRDVRDRGLPFLVAVEDETVVGYCYVAGHSWPGRKAYRHTADLSIYVRHDWRGRGAGQLLINELMNELKKTDIREVLCVMAVDDESPGGGYELRDWYDRWGFVQVGHMKNVGFKFGRWLDVLILQASTRQDKVIR